MMLSKNINDKNIVELVFFNEKKNKKDSFGYVDP